MPEKQIKSFTSLVLGALSLVLWGDPVFGYVVSIIGLAVGIEYKYKTGIMLNVIGLVLTTENFIFDWNTTSATVYLGVFFIITIPAYLLIYTERKQAPQKQ